MKVVVYVVQKRAAETVRIVLSGESFCVVWSDRNALVERVFTTLKKKKKKREDVSRCDTTNDVL